MQEDKWSTQLGERLRKLQEEAPQPYLPGAWESFEARRNQKRRIPPFWWWAGGMAASLALIFFVGLSWNGENKEQLAPQQVALETQVLQEDSPNLAAQNQGNLESTMNGEEAGSALSEQPSKKRSDSSILFPSTEQKSTRLVASNTITTEESNRTIESTTGAIPAQALANSEQAAQQVASLEEAKGSVATSTPVPMYAEINPTEATALLAQQKDPLAFAVGLGPGFGNSSEANQVTSGSRLGLGMQVDMALAGKLRIGSGLGVNYLSQATEGPSVFSLAGVNSPIEQTTQVQQVQVDLPLYVRYSLTPSKSISVQAGFSNLLAFNQAAQQELVYRRQVAAPADATTNSLGALKTMQVVETSTLAGPSTRFLPFAQANFGVNVRVYENKKTSYLLMPFYSYPLQDISGTGQNPAVLGAAVKITFGTLKK